MLKQLFGSKVEEPVVEKKAEPVEPELELPRELSQEELAEKREETIRNKLRAAARERPHPQNMLTFDSMFRPFSRVLLEQSMAVEFHEGLQVSTQRQAQNSQVSSKFSFANPQTTSWELNLQMNGFSDIMATGYSTLGRWNLMYQRVMQSGGLIVTQFMVQPQAAAMGGPPGTFYGLFQYPWITGGCSALTYFRGQHIILNHAQKIIRGMNVGAQVTYDLTTHNTSSVYNIQTHNAKKNKFWAAEWKDNGEWKIAHLNQDWANDMDMAVQLDFSEKRNGKLSSVSMGIRKPLIGGGTLTAVLQGFSKVKAHIDLPFGGDRQGLNQTQVEYCASYDIHNGNLKHGVSIQL